MVCQDGDKGIKLPWLWLPASGLESTGRPVAQTPCMKWASPVRKDKGMGVFLGNLSFSPLSFLENKNGGPMWTAVSQTSKILVRQDYFLRLRIMPKPTRPVPTRKSVAGSGTGLTCCSICSPAMAA